MGVMSRMTEIMTGTRKYSSKLKKPLGNQIIENMGKELFDIMANNLHVCKILILTASGTPKSLREA